MSRYTTLTAFIIKRINYRDADKIITVFSNEIGKQTYIAKGIRKINSKRSGSLELFNQVKFQIYKNKGMGIITDVEIIKSHDTFSKDYNITQIAYQIVELIDKLIKEEQIYHEVYSLLEVAFNYLDRVKVNKDKSEKILVHFQSSFLKMLGFGIPKNVDYNSLISYIENILEKDLVVRKSFS